MNGDEAFFAICLALAVAWVLLWVWIRQPGRSPRPSLPAPSAGVAVEEGRGTSHTEGRPDWDSLSGEADDAADTALAPGAAVARQPKMARLAAESFSTLPSEVQQTIAAHLTTGADRLALLGVCKAGRDAVLGGSQHVTIIFPLAMTAAVLKARSASLSMVSRLRPSLPVCVQLELADGNDDRHCSKVAPWVLDKCVDGVGPDHTWEVTLKGLLPGDQVVPEDLLATSCCTMSSLHLRLVGCYVNHAPPMAAHQQHGGVVHAALQQLTIDGGFNPAAGGNQLSAQLLTDMLRPQLPSLPNLHSVTIKAHTAADSASMPHVGVLGPQLHSLHVVQTAPALTAWRQSLQGYTATLTQLTHLHLESSDLGALRHADMVLLLQLPAVTHLTIPQCELQAAESLAHLPCSWQQLRIQVRNGSTLHLATFLRLPLATLQQPVQLVCRARHMSVHLYDTDGSGSAADMQALQVHMQRCGAFSWPLGMKHVYVHGIPTAQGEATRWLLAALPLLPQRLHKLCLYHMEFTQPLLHALAERWGSQLLQLTLSDRLLQPRVCDQLLARMPHITHLMLYSHEADAHGRQRLHDSVVEVCSSTTRPLSVNVNLIGGHHNLIQSQSWAERLQAAATTASARFVVSSSSFNAGEGVPAVDYRFVTIRVA